HEAAPEVVQVIRPQGDVRLRGVGKPYLQPEQGRRSPLRAVPGPAREDAAAKGRQDGAAAALPLGRGLPRDLAARRGPRLAQRNSSAWAAAHCSKPSGSRPVTSATVGCTVVSSTVPSAKNSKKASTYAFGIAASISARASSSDCGST